MITYVETIIARAEPEDGTETVVSLVTIYDKSEIDAISMKEIKALVKLIKGG